MSVDVLLGLQWGDEGKGKIVDVLTSNYDIIARFQGGPNAGHTLEFDGIKHVLHTIPSGIFHKEITNIIGNGVVIDPIIFQNEIKSIQKLNIPISSLLISKKAHLILPTHKLLDAASEQAKGKEKIGSTLKGIGPTYMDKTGRNGLRVGDISTTSFEKKYNKLKEKHLQLLKFFDFAFELEKLEEDWFNSLETLNTFEHIDSEYYLIQNINQGKKILAEGAQGTLLDIDFGSYPFVTSSNTITAGACTGLGIPPNKIKDVFGIFKAYCTRVGSGPFATELFDEIGEHLGKIGNEFGATTGRARRCGWIDLPALKYAININGVTQLMMMKSDVLSGIDNIKVCTHYEINGEKVEHLPFEYHNNLKPIYKIFNGWKMNIMKLDNLNDAPKELNEYITYLEKELKVPIKIISVGPDRKQTLFRY
ncbi:MAG: adenylosuccinate synthase [Bacteroidota bacterium]|nr:adenylosuccinate synthase [Bacteroidota bacterium]